MIGFINFVTKPSFEILINLVPECNAYLSNMKQNLIFYENALNKKEEKKIMIMKILILVNLVLV